MESSDEELNEENDDIRQKLADFLYNDDNFCSDEEETE